MLGHPRLRHPARVLNQASGLGCRHLNTSPLSSKKPPWVTVEENCRIQIKWRSYKSITLNVLHSLHIMIAHKERSRWRSSRWPFTTSGTRKCSVNFTARLIAAYSYRIFFFFHASFSGSVSSAHFLVLFVRTTAELEHPEASVLLCTRLPRAWRVSPVRHYHAV